MATIIIQKWSSYAKRQRKPQFALIIYYMADAVVLFYKMHYKALGQNIALIDLYSTKQLIGTEK